MNNITSLFPHETERPASFSSDSELYFNVWERPAFFQGKDIGVYYGDSNHKHIVRMWDDSPISIGLVGKNYKLLKNQELCESIEDTFMDSLTSEELHGVQRRDSVAYMGGTSIRDYIFPNIKVDLEGGISDIAFRAIVINGYDGSSSFKFYHGAIDFFCSNGMVTGSYDMITKRHTSSLTIPRLTDRLRGSIDIFYRQAEQWNQWINKEICDEDAEECFKAMPNVSDKRVAQLMRQFRIEVQTHGRTVWAMYSAATFYATSNSGDFAVRETGNDHKASTIMNREQQVRSWLNTEHFTILSAA